MGLATVVSLVLKSFDHQCIPRYFHPKHFLLFDPPDIDVLYRVAHVIEAGTPDARYAILELEDGRWRVTFRHVPYDHEAMAALARRNGQPELAAALATGWIR